MKTHITCLSLRYIKVYASCFLLWLFLNNFFFLQALRKRRRLSQKHEDVFFCGVSTLMKYIEGNIHTGQLAWLLREMWESETFNWVQTYTYCFLLLLNELLLIFYKHFVSATVFLGLGRFVIDQKSPSGFKLRIGTLLFLFAVTSTHKIYLKSVSIKEETETGTS